MMVINMKRIGVGWRFIITKRKEIIEIKTMVDLIMRMNYGNGDDNYEGSKGKMNYDADDDGNQKKMKVQ